MLDLYWFLCVYLGVDGELKKKNLSGTRIKSHC